LFLHYYILIMILPWKEAVFAKRDWLRWKRTKMKAFVMCSTVQLLSLYSYWFQISNLNSYYYYYSHFLSFTFHLSFFIYLYQRRRRTITAIKNTSNYNIFLHIRHFILQFFYMNLLIDYAKIVLHFHRCFNTYKLLTIVVIFFLVPSPTRDKSLKLQKIRWMKNLIEIYEKYTFCSDIFLFLENKKVKQTAAQIFCNTVK
jgi:hypothetical protein